MSRGSKKMLATKPAPNVTSRICRHCKEYEGQPDRRGLCRGCWNDKSIRNQYGLLGCVAGEPANRSFDLAASTRQFEETATRLARARQADDEGLALVGGRLVRVGERVNSSLPVPDLQQRRDPCDKFATVGKRIEFLRELHGMSVADLAERVGMNRRTLYRIEDCLHKVSVAAAMAIAQALNEPLSRLIGEG